MPANPTEWNARYRTGGAPRGGAPSGILQELLPLIRPGRSALDMACGSGRNSILLAAAGYSVTAVDWSSAAIDLLETRCNTAGWLARRLAELPGRDSPPGQGIQLLVADLVGLRLPPETYDLVLCLNYLERSLFAGMVRALRPGGFLIFETFTRAQLDYAGGPRNPDYLLNCGELREAFPELTLIFYRELRAGQGVASLLAEKPVPGSLRPNRAHRPLPLIAIPEAPPYAKSGE